MTVKVFIDTSEHGGVRITDEQLAQIRVAVGDPQAPITGPAASPL